MVTIKSDQVWWTSNQIPINHHELPLKITIQITIKIPFKITIKIPSNLIKQTNISMFVGSHTPASPACPSRRQQHPSEIPAATRSPRTRPKRRQSQRTARWNVARGSWCRLLTRPGNPGRSEGEEAWEHKLWRVSDLGPGLRFLDCLLIIDWLLILERSTHFVFFPGLSFKLFFIYIVYDCRDMRVD
jgi:hypothetical protein